MFIETDTMAHGPPKLTPLSINTAVCVFWMFAKHWNPIERSPKTDTQTLKHANGIRGSSYNAGRGKMMIKVYRGYGQLGTKSLKKVNHRNSVQWKWIPHSGAVALDYEQKQSTLTEQSFVADNLLQLHCCLNKIWMRQQFLTIEESRDKINSGNFRYAAVVVQHDVQLRHSLIHAIIYYVYMIYVQNYAMLNYNSSTVFN